MISEQKREYKQMSVFADVLVIISIVYRSLSMRIEHIKLYEVNQNEREGINEPGLLNSNFNQEQLEKD